MMRAKSVLVLRQNLQAQDSATEERSNRASSPIVKFPRVSPSESSFDHRERAGQGRGLGFSKGWERCEPVKEVLNSEFADRRSAERVVTRHVISFGCMTEGDRWVITDDLLQSCSS